MEKPGNDALFEQVVRLERECGQLRRANRWWRRAGTVALVGTVAVLTAGADMPTSKLEPTRLKIWGMTGARIGIKIGRDGERANEWVVKANHDGKLDVETGVIKTTANEIIWSSQSPIKVSTP